MFNDDDDDDDDDYYYKRMLLECRTVKRKLREHLTTTN